MSSQLGEEDNDVTGIAKEPFSSAKRCGWEIWSDVPGEKCSPIPCQVRG